MTITKKRALRNTDLFLYDHPSEFLEQIKKLEAKYPRHSVVASEEGFNTAAWHGGTFREAVELLKNGDTDQNIERVESLVDQIEANVHVTEVQNVWQTDIQGFIPHVPNYLQGMPDAMFRPFEQRVDSSGLVRVVMCIGGSASVPPATLQTRGAAVAALCQKLSQFRPVELWAVHAMGYDIGSGQHVYAIKLGIAPLPVREITFVLSHPAMIRRLGFLHTSQTKSREQTWLPQPWGASGKKIADYVSAIFDLTDDDIVIQKAVSERPFEVEPIEWVHKQLEPYLNA